MIKDFLLFASILICASCFGQTKEGYQLVYLDDSFAKTDSASAYYFAYSYYHKNRDVSGVSDMISYMHDPTISYYGAGGNIGSPTLLNGKILFEEDELLFTREFINGYPFRFEQLIINENDTSYYSISYFDSLYNNQPGTYYIKDRSYCDSLYNQQLGTYYIDDRDSGYITTSFYRDGKSGWQEYGETDSRGIEFSKGKYPYWNGLTPPFVGVVASLEGFRSYGYEFGVAVNIAEISGDVFGGMGGFIATYKNRFDNSFQSLCFEFGIYMPVSFGVGYSFHFNEMNQTNSFKLFVGITLFHAQILYNYNFYRNSKNQIPELFHHSFTLRFALPIIRI